MAKIEIQIRNAKPKEKACKPADGGSLYLLVMPHGLKHWRMNYRFNGKNKTIAFDMYPEVPLRVLFPIRYETTSTFAVPW